MGRRVTLKLKTADFRIRTRQRRLGAPTQAADDIFAAGLELLEREADGTAYRLVGIGLSDFSEPREAVPGNFVDDGAWRRARVEQAVDTVRDRFGFEAIGKGRRLRQARDRG